MHTDYSAQEFPRMISMEKNGTIVCVCGAISLGACSLRGREGLLYVRQEYQER